jgi:hypothetical protein
MNNKLFRIVRACSLMAALTAVTGCSYVSWIWSSDETGRQGGPEIISIGKPDSIEVFLSRTSLQTTEFEQYKFAGGKLFFECGEIRRGRFAPEDQEFIEVEPDIREALDASGGDLAQYLAGRKYSLDKPGKNSSLLDPGQLYLTMRFGGQTTEIRTSLDSVTEPDSGTERKIATFVEELRGATPKEPCGNRTFYGFSRIRKEDK